MLLLAALLISFAATILFVPLVRWVALRRGWVDLPDRERKLHSRPTPNVGGLAIAAGFGVGLIGLVVVSRFSSFQIQLPGTAMLVGALVMVVTGFFDDIKHVSFRKKFFIQIAIAYVLLLAGYRIEVADIPFLQFDPYTEALFSIPLTILWVVAIINAVNLLDGLDGLASGVALIAFGCLALIFGQHGGNIGITAIALLMMGALAGFLVYNFNPASIFMGDSGSLFLGYMLAVFTLEGKSHTDPVLAILIPTVVLGLPLLDTGLCMVRRLIAGKSPYAPDNDHIHHRLDRLLSQKKAVLVLYAVAIWFSIAGILITRYEVSMGLAVAFFTLIAAYVGIRTLGYLDLSRFRIARSRRNVQLSLDLEPDGYPPSGQKKSLRRHYSHHDVATGNRTLPGKMARTRAPWRRDLDLDDDDITIDEQIKVPVSEKNGMHPTNRHGAGYLGNDANSAGGNGSHENRGNDRRTTLKRTLLQEDASGDLVAHTNGDTNGQSNGSHH